MSDPMTDPLRDELQRSLGAAYTLERELGGGGMSRVFVAREHRLGRDVVVKLLSPTLASELSAERFEREIALAARLQEPHIVPVLSAGETADGLPYYTMPFVAGESLRARLTRGRIGTGEAVSILRDVARALAYAHEHGVVHRDIKPENVLLSSGTAVVTDFGIAKAISASRTVAHEAADLTLTRAGTSIGTPAYMSPEQATGSAVDGYSDVYAWGVLAYELLAGEHPFAGRTTAPQLISAHLAEAPRPLGTRVAGLSPAVATLVMRALAKDPAARPSSAELLAGLDAPRGSDALTHGAARRAGAVALLALLAAGAVALIGRARRAAPGDTSRVESASPITALAVMPFANTGGDRNDDYFSDGLSDELAHALVRLPGLRVAGRASARALAARHATATEIGRSLGVGAILEGTVRRAGERLRVTAELTSTADGKVLWTSEPFESTSGDVFAVQDEFTRAVITALAPRLRGESGSTPARFGRGTRDARAYDLYLHGRYYWARRGVANLNRSIDFFRRAVAADSGFARAHAGLALAYAVLPFFDATVASDSTMAPAVRSAERALALDPASADAHLALANIYSRQFRQADARAQFLAALADAPSDATAHAWYADYLERTGHGDSALVEKKRALELEPLSALFANHLAQTLYLQHRLPEAITAAHRAPELDSTFTRAYYTIARIQLFRGFPDSALAAIDLATRFGPRFRGLRGLRVLALAAADRWPEARSLRATIIADPDPRAADGDRMIAALAFGDRADAMQTLERTIASHELQTFAGHAGCDPLLQPLLADPQFVATIRRLGTAVCAADLRWPVTTTPR